MHEAKCNIEMELWNAAANRLYYACYNIVSALLIQNGIEAQTHKGVAGMFALHFVKEGIVPREAGKTYNQILSLRQTGDYDDWIFLEPEDVTRMIEPAETLIETIEKLLKQ